MQSNQTQAGSTISSTSLATNPGNGSKKTNHLSNQTQAEEMFKEVWGFSIKEAFEKSKQTFESFSYTNNNRGVSPEYVKTNLIAYVNDSLLDDLLMMMHGKSDRSLNSQALMEHAGVSGAILDLMEFIFSNRYKWEKQFPQQIEFKEGSVEDRLQELFIRITGMDDYESWPENFSEIVAYAVRPELAKDVTKKRIGELLWLVKFTVDFLDDLHECLKSFEGVTVRKV